MRKLIKHFGNSMYLDRDKDGITYILERFVNGEPLVIGSMYDEDTTENRDDFIKEADLAFARARAAPFN